MENDSDYLWDKTGEPDTDIQQLEEILGTLRYQPRPLEIPAGLSIGRERNFFRSSAPRLAIAATIAMLLIGLGVWIAFQRSQRKPPSLAQAPKQAPAQSPNTPGVKSSPDAQPVPVQNSAVAAAPERKETTELQRHRGSHRVNRSLVAVNSNRANNEARKAKERQEAVAAKDQLLLALRVVSAKLSFAQKKTQTPNAPEPVHNQHKIG